MQKYKYIKYISGFWLSHNIVLLIIVYINVFRMLMYQDSFPAHVRRNKRILVGGGVLFLFIHSRKISAH